MKTYTYEERKKILKVDPKKYDLAWIVELERRVRDWKDGDIPDLIGKVKEDMQKKIVELKLEFKKIYGEEAK